MKKWELSFVYRYLTNLIFFFQRIQLNSKKMKPISKLIPLQNYLLCAVAILLVSNFRSVAAFGQTFIQPSIQDSDSVDNVLTSREIKEGWQLLFDGHTLRGWRTYRKEPSNTWLVSDHSLYCKKDSSRAATFADLITEGEYENFELSLDWKISPQSNSGILYLVTEAYDKSYLSGPEYQLIDDRHYPEKIADWQKTGANYAMNAPSLDATHPVGSWNHTVIRVENGQVEHWLNGIEVVKYQIGSKDWKHRKAVSKWKDDPGYAASPKGHIAFQGDHGGGLWFRNIKIRVLPHTR